jgi:hypothetical protein
MYKKAIDEALIAKRSILFKGKYTRVDRKSLY